MFNNTLHLVGSMTITMFVAGFMFWPEPGLGDTEMSPESIAAIKGNWATQGYGAVVQFGSCASDEAQLCGTLVWVWDPEEMEPNAVGRLMIEGAIHHNGEWAKGTLWNPEDGRTYRGTITQISNDVLKLKGCAAGIFCQTQIWHRLESLPHVRGFDPNSPNSG